MFVKNNVDNFIYRKFFLEILVKGYFVDVLDLGLVGEVILKTDFWWIVFDTKVDRYNFKWIVRDRHC